MGWVVLVAAGLSGSPQALVVGPDGWVQPPNRTGYAAVPDEVGLSRVEVDPGGPTARTTAGTAGAVVEGAPGGVNASSESLVEGGPDVNGSRRDVLVEPDVGGVNVSSRGPAVDRAAGGANVPSWSSFVERDVSGVNVWSHNLLERDPGGKNRSAPTQTVGSLAELGGDPAGDYFRGPADDPDYKKKCRIQPCAKSRCTQNCEPYSFLQRTNPPEGCYLAECKLFPCIKPENGGCCTKACKTVEFCPCGKLLTDSCCSDTGKVCVEGKLMNTCESYSGTKSDKLGGSPSTAEAVTPDSEAAGGAVLDPEEAARESARHKQVPKKGAGANTAIIVTVASLVGVIFCAGCAMYFQSVGPPSFLNGLQPETVERRPSKSAPA